MNILLIEDEEALSEVAALQLRNLGNSVHPVSKLEEAARFLDQPGHSLDLIIADHRLPDGGGIDFVIERARSGCAIPVVVVSGCLTIADVAVLERERIPYFRKPVVYSEVVRRFKKPPSVSRDAPEIRLRDVSDRGSGFFRGLFGR